MSRPLIQFPFLLLLGVSLAAPISAQTEREHGVHVHGRTQINLALDEGVLELELLAPGMDIVGFEHAPGDATQQAAIDAALETLREDSTWLAFEPDAACRISERMAHTHGYAAPESEAEATRHDHDDHDHASAGHGEPLADESTGHDDHDDHSDHADHDDHDDHHDHEHADGHDHDHAEFHLRLRADCNRAPRAIQLRLSERFPGIELLRVDLITPSRQDRVELSRGQTRVALD